MEIDKHKKQFGVQAEDYTKYRKPYPEKLYEFLFSLLATNQKKILDIACGTGKSTEPLLRNDTEVSACDHDPLMIEEAKRQAVAKNLTIDYRIAETEQLPYEDDSFNVVTIGTALHWFVNEKAIAEIRRVLKNDGLIFVFWTSTIEDAREENKIILDVFRSYHWERVSPEFRDLEYISNFFQQNGFRNISTARIPFSHNDTVEERVGLEKTNSGYGLLSPEDKKRFLDDLRGALTTALGAKSHFSIQEEVQVCYGFR